MNEDLRGRRKIVNPNFFLNFTNHVYVKSFDCLKLKDVLFPQRRKGERSKSAICKEGRESCKQQEFKGAIELKIIPAI